jgi:hypothetical protein
LWKLALFFDFELFLDDGRSSSIFISLLEDVIFLSTEASF